MADDDVMIALFPSRFDGGDVDLWYCPRGERYELRYTVRFSVPDGFCDAQALCAYDAGDGSQVVALVLDAVDIARTPLWDRD